MYAEEFLGDGYAGAGYGVGENPTPYLSYD
jgi:hypothetical protein